MTNANSFLLLDSCVIFDFMKADGELFTLASRYVGPVYVADALIPELQDFCGVEEIEEVGLRTLEVDKSDLDAASALSETGPLSYYDVVCLLTARRLGCVCVTNDRNLRKACEREQVALFWGLELVFRVFQAGGIDRERARRIGEQIGKRNRWISRKVLERFFENLERA